MLAVVVRGDCRAQLRNTQRYRVTELVEVQGGGRGGTYRLWCADAGLARRKVHQIAVGALAFGGRQPDVHHIKRWDARSTGDVGVHGIHGIDGPAPGASDSIGAAALAVKQVGGCCRVLA